MSRRYRPAYLSSSSTRPLPVASMEDFFKSEKSGLEARETVPGLVFPFQPDFRPVSYTEADPVTKKDKVVPLLPRSQRIYLSGIRMAVDTLRMVRLTDKQYNRQFDTTATMIAELLSAIARNNKSLESVKMSDTSYAFMTVKDSPKSNSPAIQEDLAYLYLGQSSPDDSKRTLQVISPRYQEPKGKWAAYAQKLVPFYEQLSGTVSKFSGVQNFWMPLTGRETVGILETRIMAMLAYLLIKKHKVIKDATARLEDLKDYADIMMRELQIFLDTYGRPARSSSTFSVAPMNVSIAPSV